MNSERVGGDYKRVVELIVLSCLGKVSNDLQLFLADKKVKNVFDAAVCADDYYLICNQFKPKDTSKAAPPKHNVSAS